MEPCLWREESMAACGESVGEAADRAALTAPPADNNIQPLLSGSLGVSHCNPVTGTKLVLLSVTLLCLTNTTRREGERLWSRTETVPTRHIWHT